MRAAVGALSRRFACLRAQIDLMPAAEAYVEQWKDAMERRETLPAYSDYFRDAAYAARVPILEEGPFAAYLEGCADDYRLPDPARIVQAIVHAHAEMRLWVDKRCSCPARQWLLSPVKEEDGEEGREGHEDEWEEEDPDEDEKGYEDDEEEEGCEDGARLDG